MAAKQHKGGYTMLASFKIGYFNGLKNGKDDDLELSMAEQIQYDLGYKYGTQDRNSLNSKLEEAYKAGYNKAKQDTKEKNFYSTIIKA